LIFDKSYLFGKFVTIQISLMNRGVGTPWCRCASGEELHGGVRNPRRGWM